MNASPRRTRPPCGRAKISGRGWETDKRGLHLKDLPVERFSFRQVRVRRASTYDELNRLLVVAGPRRVGYLRAFFTGLRRGELKALQWGDIHLEVEQPFIAPHAATTKNAAPASIRLHPQRVGELRNMRPAEASAADPVVSRENQASMWMMRKGPEAAGISFADA